MHNELYIIITVNITVITVVTNTKTPKTRYGLKHSYINLYTNTGGWNQISWTAI